MKISNAVLSIFAMSTLLVSCGQSGLSSLQTLESESEDTNVGFKYTVVSDSEIKTEYFNSESCLLASESIVTLDRPVNLENENHVLSILKIESDKDEGCHIDSEFIFDGMVNLQLDILEEIKPAVAEEKPVLSTSDSVVDTRTDELGLSRNMRAFLDVIAYAEGTNDSYDISFTFKRFYSFDRHRALYCSGGLCSDAAGRYQFLSTTWSTVANSLGLYDFSPKNQDLAAVELIRRRGALNAVEIVDGPNTLGNALRKCSLEWASLPGSPYGQPVKTVSELWNVFKSH